MNDKVKLSRSNFEMSDETIKTPDYADFQNWMKALALKVAAIRSDIQYDYATGFCSNCPRRRDSDELDSISNECCKDTEEWETQYEPDYEYIKKLEAARAAIKALIPEDES